MEIRNFPRQDLLEFTRALRDTDPTLAERSQEDEVLFARTPGATLGEMQENAALQAHRLEARSRKLAWASSGLLLAAGVSVFSLISSSPGPALGLGLALGLGSGACVLAGRRASREANDMVRSRARLGTYGSVLATLTERRESAEREVGNLARGLTPEQSLTIRQDKDALIVGGVRVKRHSGKSES